MAKASCLSSVWGRVMSTNQKQWSVTCVCVCVCVCVCLCVCEILSQHLAVCGMLTCWCVCYHDQSTTIQLWHQRLFFCEILLSRLKHCVNCHTHTYIKRMQTQNSTKGCFNTEQCISIPCLCMDVAECVLSLHIMLLVLFIYHGIMSHTYSNVCTCMS